MQERTRAKKKFRDVSRNISLQEILQTQSLAKPVRPNSVVKSALEAAK